MASVVICYSSNRKRTHRSMSPKASSCIPPVTGSSQQPQPALIITKSLLVGPKLSPRTAFHCANSVLLGPLKTSHSLPFWCLKVVFMGVIPPPQFFPSLCLPSPECFSDCPTRNSYQRNLIPHSHLSSELRGSLRLRPKFSGAETQPSCQGRN